MKNFIIGFSVILAVLAGVILFNTVTFYSLQQQVEPITDNPVYRKRSIDKLAGAVQIPTISHQDTSDIDYGRFEQFIGYLEQQFPMVHSELEQSRVSGYSLLYRWSGRDTTAPPVILAGHYDVVPAPDSMVWVHPPFSGRVSGGYIWGRGTLDDKVGVIGILEAVEMLLEEGHQPATDIYLAFGHDEEIGGLQGARQIVNMLKARNLEPRFVLDEGMMITEGIMPGVDQPLAIIGTGEKGNISLELTARGESGHSSIPPNVTSIGKLSRAITRLQENPFPARMDAIAGSLFSYLGPELPFLQKMAVANRWAFDPVLKWQLLETPSTAALLRTTTAPTIFKAGIKDNVLPSEARAVVNFRILPGDSIQTVFEHVRNVVADTSVRLRQLDEATNPRPLAPVDSESFQLLHHTVRQVHSEAIVAPGLLVAASDGRHYADLTDRVYSFSPFTIGPEDLGRFHGNNERIGVNSYHKYILYYYQLIKNQTEYIDLRR
ncbi:MAG: M20 family peptidase [Balneolaceae bacterium]|nr:M20 family peptidase [Balneolaceae bacterium]